MTMTKTEKLWKKLEKKEEAKEKKKLKTKATKATLTVAALILKLRKLDPKAEVLIVRSDVCGEDVCGEVKDVRFEDNEGDGDSSAAILMMNPC